MENKSKMVEKIHTDIAKNNEMLNDLEVKEKLLIEKKDSNNNGLKVLLGISALKLLLESIDIFTFLPERTLINLLSEVIKFEISFPVTILNIILGALTVGQVLYIQKLNKEEKELKIQKRNINIKKAENIRNLSKKLKEIDEINKEVTINKSNETAIKPISQMTINNSFKKLQKRAR